MQQLLFIIPCKALTRESRNICNIMLYILSPSIFQLPALLSSVFVRPQQPLQQLDSPTRNNNKKKAPTFPSQTI
jgi:hypothetical protein